MNLRRLNLSKRWKDISESWSIAPMSKIQILDLILIDKVQIVLV